MLHVSAIADFLISKRILHDMKQFLRTRLHVSWLIAISSVGIFGGVVCAALSFGRLFASLSWLLTGVALCVFAYLKQRRYVVLFALIGGVLIGLWRGGVEQAALIHYEGLQGRTVTLSGEVSEDVDNDKRGKDVLRLKRIRYAERDLPGMVWVTTNRPMGVQRSDRIVIEGKLSEGFGTFAASMYDAETKKITKGGDIGVMVRDWFAQFVRMAIPEPESSLGIGYLVGQRRNLPEELDQALKIAGLTHIVVASGYNLTILVRFARRFFMRISKYMAALASTGLVVGFIGITGMSPSMSRAGLIALLSLLAWYYGRKFHPVVLLLFAVAVTVLFNPSYAWGDVGWQLSFAAFAGVMIFAPLLQAYYFGAKKPGTLRQILGETISATVCTLPIILYYFGQMSNVAVIANLLVLPLVPLAMLLTFVAGVGAFIVPAAAVIVGFPAQVLLGYMVQVAMYLAQIPWAVVELKITAWYALGMYVLLAVFAVYMWRKTRFDLRTTNIVE